MRASARNSVILSVMAALLFFSVTPAEALSRPSTLTATGIFKSVNKERKPPVIVLNVNNAEASAPLHPSCVFLDSLGKEISKDAFVEKYLKQVITVELYENSGEVFLCRVGS